MRLRIHSKEGTVLQSKRVNDPTYRYCFIYTLVFACCIVSLASLDIPYNYKNTNVMSQIICDVIDATMPANHQPARISRFLALLS